MATDGPTTTDTPPPPPPPPPPDTSTREKASALDGRGLSGGAAQDATRPEHESDSARTAEPGTQDKMSPLDGDPTPHEPQNTDQQSPAKQDREPQGLEPIGLEPPRRSLEPTPEFQPYLDDRKAAMGARPSDQADPSNEPASQPEPAVRPEPGVHQPAAQPEQLGVESEPPVRPEAAPDLWNAPGGPDASTAPGTRGAPEVPAAREEPADGRDPAGGQNVPEPPTAPAPESGPDRQQPSRQEPDVPAGSRTSEIPEAPTTEETSSVVGDDNGHGPYAEVQPDPDPEPERPTNADRRTDANGSPVEGETSTRTTVDNDADDPGVSKPELTGAPATEADTPTAQADGPATGDVRTSGDQRDTNDGLIDPDAVSVKPDGSPWPESPLSRIEPLPKLNETDLRRGESGLIESVDGTPIRDYLHGLADERTEGYLDARRDGTIPKDQVAPVTSVLLDTRTGRLYEAINQEAEIPTDLHPILQERLDGLVAEAGENPEAYQYRFGELGGFPHPDVAGRHAEVLNVSRALYDREAMGYQVSAESLGEMLLDNRFPYRPEAKMAAPCCPNCTAILGGDGGVESIPGKLPVDEWRRQ
ncbi:YwqJ-related putative deaminase [Parafrankia sp. FMc6]|uniref:YwqJ-related putative deaminase n=1 Tax=Parafrankia soli TaxID=2599596 RepID=UPI0034D429C9